MAKIEKLTILLLLLLVPVKMSGQARQKIDRTQTSKPVTKKPSSKPQTRKSNTQSVSPYLTISSKMADFSSEGGSKTFTVSSSGSWRVSTETDSWGHLTRNGNSLTLRVDANNGEFSRTDYFILSSGSKTVRVNITQAGGVSLSISSQNLNFGSSGGTQTITVSTNGSWRIGTGTYSWGHLTRDGNLLRVRIDENAGTDSRTDYFTIKAGNQEKRINIVQSGASSSWAISGTSRSYTDIATGLKYIADEIKKEGTCRLGAITEYGEGVAIYGTNGAMWSSIPSSLSNKIKEIGNNKKRISSVTLTHSGYFCITYERNAWYGIVPENMKLRLNEYNNNGEEFWSVSICENGNWAIVTDKHFVASNNVDQSNMKKAQEQYGTIKNVCITNYGICVVCKNGIFYSNIPTSVETKIKNIDFHPDHLTFTDSGTCLITSESGRYSYFM